MRELYVLYGNNIEEKSRWADKNRLVDYIFNTDTFTSLITSGGKSARGWRNDFNRHRQDIVELMMQAIAMRLENGELTMIPLTFDDRRIMNSVLKFISDAKPQIECNIVCFEETDKCQEQFTGLLNDTNTDLFKFISPDEAISILKHIDEMDAGSYKFIDIFGDIHGCAVTLLRALVTTGAIASEFASIDVDDADAINGIETADDHLIVFLGDYTDRGPKSASVLRIIDRLLECGNTILLEGNHERWVRNWLRGDADKLSKTFVNTTLSQLEKTDDMVEVAKRVQSSLVDSALLKFGSRYIFCCHGGISRLPYLQRTVSSNDMIYGYGRRDETGVVHATWDKYTDPRHYHSDDERMRGAYMVHGHRHEGIANNNHISKYGRAICLENGIERGGSLMFCQFGLNERGRCKSPSLFSLVGSEQ